MSIIDEAITVKELIEALQKLGDEHLNKKCISEGCDCDGAVSSVEIGFDGNVYLRRG